MNSYVISIKDIISLHEKVYESMVSRKLTSMLYFFKENNDEVSKSVAALMFENKSERKYDMTYFTNSVIEKFSYL